MLPADSSNAKKDDWDRPARNLLSAAERLTKEKWNGVRMSPSDPGIEARTGFALVKPFQELRATRRKPRQNLPSIYTILPYKKEMGGYPHEKEVVDWLNSAAPQVTVKDIRANITELAPRSNRPREIAFLRQAIELSDRRAPGSHEDDAARPVGVSGSRQNGGSPRHGRLRSGSLRSHRRRRTEFHCAPLRQTLPQNCRTATSSFWTLARNTPATPPTSPAPFPPTASSRRASARSMKSFWARRMPRMRRAETRHGHVPQG